MREVLASILLVFFSFSAFADEELENEIRSENASSEDNKGLGNRIRVELEGSGKLMVSVSCQDLSRTLRDAQKTSN